MKIEVELPLTKETTGALRYSVADIASVPVGSVYIRKNVVPKIDGRWPSAVKVTVEVAGTTAHMSPDHNLWQCGHPDCVRDAAKAGASQ